MKEYIGHIEKPQPSVKLAVEVALAGIALWQLKRAYDRRADNPGEPLPANRPVVEAVENSNVYIYPSSASTNGQPKEFTIGSVAGPEGSIAISGRLDENSDFVLEENSETDPTRLQILKRNLDQALAKIEDRASKFKEIDNS